MKGAHRAQRECRGEKGKPVTLAVQEFLLQASLEKKVSRDPQGDQDDLAPQVPQEELLRVTFLSRAHLEIRDPLALMVREELLGLQVPREVSTS